MQAATADAPPAALTAELLTDLPALERLAPEWDALAATAGKPAALAGWQLAWWRQLAPPGALLRAVAVRDGERLVALAPYAALPRPHGRFSYELLASAITHRTEPLAAPGAEAAAAQAIARTLAASRPAVGELRLDAADGDGVWLQALRSGWPGRRRPWTLTDATLAAPFAELRYDDLDAWLASRSSNFRQQARRFRRRLLAAGGTLRMTDAVEQLETDVEAFVRLHHARRDERGGSALGRDIGPLLCDAGRVLLPAGRFRLWTVELEGRAVASLLFLVAGETALYWNGGFDPEAAALRPSLVAIVEAIGDFIARGERTLDLGGGAQDYKLRIADGERPLAWSLLVPYDRRHLRNRAAVAKRELKHAAQRIPEPQRARLRRLLGR